MNIGVLHDPNPLCTHSLGCFLSLVLCVTREAGIFNPLFIYLFLRLESTLVQSIFNENKILPHEHKNWDVRNMSHVHLIPTRA